MNASSPASKNVIRLTGDVSMIAIAARRFNPAWRSDFYPARAIGGFQRRKDAARANHALHALRRDLKSAIAVVEAEVGQRVSGSKKAQPPTVCVPAAEAEVSQAVESELNLQDRLFGSATQVQPNIVKERAQARRTACSSTRSSQNALGVSWMRGEAATSIRRAYARTDDIGTGLRERGHRLVQAGDQFRAHHAVDPHRLRKAAKRRIPDRDSARHREALSAASPRPDRPAW